jgi:hypothetical protein
MDTLILSKFLRASPAQRAQWIGSAPQYIQNDGFINLLNMMDINDKKGDTIRNVAKLSTAFNGLLENAKKWLNS